MMSTLTSAMALVSVLLIDVLQGMVIGLVTRSYS
jgi:hypothetical protein